MTPSEYWEGDPELVRAYRKAQKMRDEREDALAWLQGRYIYDALRYVSPLFHDFVKGRPKEHPYGEKPYMELVKHQRVQDTREIKKQNGLAFMMQYAAKFNGRRKETQSGNGGEQTCR